MATVNVSGTHDATTITGNNTYILTGIDAGYKRTIAVLQLTKGIYDGTITVSARAKGSTAVFKPIGYTNLATQTVATTGITADALISLDATGLDVALVTTLSTTGALTVDLSVVDQY
jgi:hypothetical protein